MAPRSATMMNLSETCRFSDDRWMEKPFPPLLRSAGRRGGSPRLVLLCLSAGLGGGEPRLVLLRVSPTGRCPDVRQLLPGLPSEMSVRGVQAPRRRIALAVCRLQGGWPNLCIDSLLHVFKKLFCYRNKVNIKRCFFSFIGHYL